MATSQQILDSEFESLKNDLIKEYDSLGMRASGDFAKSLEVVSETNNVKLFGNNYAEQLEFGRRPGKRPPIQALKDWIVDKGIVNQIKGNITVTSLAFAIATKIAKQGWKRKDHGGVELISKIITPQRIQKIIDMVGAELALTLVKTITIELKKITI